MGSLTPRESFMAGVCRPPRIHEVTVRCMQGGSNPSPVAHFSPVVLRAAKEALGGRRRKEYGSVDAVNRLLVAAAFGFAFVAVWRFGGFDSALMCGLGALIAVAAVLLVEGDLDLGELRRRLVARRRSNRVIVRGER
jgi:hypothetical protein